MIFHHYSDNSDENQGLTPSQALELEETLQQTMEALELLRGMNFDPSSSDEDEESDHDGGDNDDHGEDDGEEAFLVARGNSRIYVMGHTNAGKTQFLKSLDKCHDSILGSYEAPEPPKAKHTRNDLQEELLYTLEKCLPSLVHSE